MTHAYVARLSSTWRKVKDINLYVNFPVRFTCDIRQNCHCGGNRLSGMFYLYSVFARKVGSVVIMLLFRVYVCYIQF